MPRQPGTHHRLKPGARRAAAAATALKDPAPRAGRNSSA